MVDQIGTAMDNSMESDHGCTSRICFDHAGDNVMLTFNNVTLTSQKPCLHNNKCECSKTNGYKGSLCFVNKISLRRYFIEKYINFNYSAD